jgi:DNA-binding NtrC family response regulator
MMPPTILVVDDEQLLRWSLKERLQQAGYRVLEAENGAQAVQCLEEPIDLALLDYRLPDTNGLDLLAKVKQADPDTLVILMTAYSSIESAVEAIKQGAYHYANKPFNLDEMMLLVDKALETTSLRREVKALRASQSAPYAIDQIIGSSPVMRDIKALLGKVAASPASTVLLTGESGTGKDLAAKVIHYASGRASGPFMNITCSALAETLLESELFGHERGAFTDAKQQKKGLLELSDQGTVYLDEIGEMPPLLQAKVLRFLEERAFKRVGGTADIRVDVRIIAATNRDLEKEVREGRFREDLYYRLSVLPVLMPPLRERGDDILNIVKHYVDRFNEEFRRNVKDLTPDAIALLKSHAWPGNIRELRNAVERAMLLTDGDVLTAEDFRVLVPGQKIAEGFRLPTDGIDFEQLEKELVIQALERSGGNQTRAAALLGMNRDQIRYRIEKFGLARAKGSTR